MEEEMKDPGRTTALYSICALVGLYYGVLLTTHGLVVRATSENVQRVMLVPFET